MKEIKKEYELFLHWKQGDEFNSCIEEAKGNVCEALLLWSQKFQFNAMVCEDLANRFAGKKIEVCADTHYISITGDNEVLEECVKENLLGVFDNDAGGEEEEPEDINPAPAAS